MIDQATDTTVATKKSYNEGGTYSFTFSDVSPGSYFIVAGTDSDNDGYICDPGEACGGYPTIDLLQAIQIVDSGRDDLNFATGFSLDFGVAAASAGNSPQRFKGYSKYPEPRKEAGF